MNQRKHDLQKNELADFLGKEADVAWQHLPKVVIGVLAVAVLGVGLYYLTSQPEDPVVAQGWQHYFTAYGEPDQALYLSQHLEQTKTKTIATLWSKQALADFNFSNATGKYMTMPEEAKKALAEAEKWYAEVADDPATNETLKAKALFGLARTLEEEQKFDEAKAKFALVAEKEKESPLGKMAAAAGKRLNDPQQIEFLTWFAKQDLRPTSSLMNDLQDRPKINFPGMQGSGTSGDGPGTGLKGIGVGDSGISLPAGGQNPLGIPGVTGGSTPAKEPAATEPATEGEKPAAEPATTEPAATEPANEAAAETPATPKTEAAPEAPKTEEPPAAK